MASKSFLFALIVILFGRCKIHQNDAAERLVDCKVLAASDTANYRELINWGYQRDTSTAILFVLYQIEFKKLAGTYDREWVPGSYAFDKPIVEKAVQKAKNKELHEYLFQLENCGLINRTTRKAQTDSIRRDIFFAKIELLKELSKLPGNYR